jgi:hypothetical protein
MLKPVLAALLFLAATYYFSYVFNPGTNNLLLFISSPFNISTEGMPLFNIAAPALLIFIIAFYLKNFNDSFVRKASLRAVYVFAIAASYIKSFIGIFMYGGGISLGTSIIALSFIATFLIALEVLIKDKEAMGHLYGPFMIYFLATLLLLLIFFSAISFFTGISADVHIIGVLVFLLLFIPYYERANLSKFLKNEERAVLHSVRSSAAR